MNAISEGYFNQDFEAVVFIIFILNSYETNCRICLKIVLEK